jgi:hypothetical protein
MTHYFCIEYLYLTCSAAGQIVSVSSDLLNITGTGAGQIVSVSWRTCRTLSAGACCPPSTLAYSPGSTLSRNLSTLRILYPVSALQCCGSGSGTVGLNGSSHCSGGSVSGIRSYFDPRIRDPGRYKIRIRDQGNISDHIPRAS